MIAKDKMMSTNPGVARPLVWLAMIAIGVAVGIFAAGVLARCCF